MPMPFQDDSRSGPLTVSELTGRIKETLEAGFPDVYVVGEISRYTKAASGHVYLTLKDEKAVLSGVIWRGVASKLRFKPEEGMEVLARGAIDLYPPRGNYQLIVSWMEPRGLGALQLAFRQLMAKLEAEGLFREEHKQPLPAYPARIGVVTSPTGAAFRDIINVISRRFPVVELLLMPVRVQGEKAAGELAFAIAALNAKRPDLDVLIVTRGGGSLEDLWPFNEEMVARAIFRSRIPVISAVGHEIDFSISDYVADVRAATPTEAGEIVVPDREEVRARLTDRRQRLALALQGMVERGWERLAALASRYVFRRPEAALRERTQRLDDVMLRTQTLMGHRLSLLRETTLGAGRRLEALSPLRVLERGYSVMMGPDGRVVRAADDVSTGDKITTRLHKGTVLSEILSTREGPGSGTEEKAVES